MFRRSGRKKDKEAEPKAQQGKRTKNDKSQSCPSSPKGSKRISRKKSTGSSVSGSTAGSRAASPSAKERAILEGAANKLQIQVAGLMVDGGGALDGCPLKSSDYEEAWEGNPVRRQSRLYTNFDAVLSDETASGFLVQYLHRIEALHLLKFWMATEKFTKLVDSDEIAKAAMDIYSSYVSVASNLNVGIPENVRKSIEASIAPEPGQSVPTSCFKEAAATVYDNLEKQLFQRFLNSEYYFRYCIEILTSADVLVEDVLLNDTAMISFMEFMERENASRLVQFYIVCDNFQEQMQSDPPLSPTQARGDAMGLYNRYFSLQAQEPLGVDEGTRVSVESNICREGGIRDDCFARPLHLVHTAFDQFYFPNYQQSDLYYQYLDELVKASTSVTTPKASFSTAAPTTSKAPRKGDGKLTGEETHENNDDEKETPLPYLNGMMGSIDEWGVYVRDGEVTEAEGMDVLSGKRNNKKWNRGNQPDEATALQISQMIIKGVYREMKSKCTLFIPPVVTKKSDRSQSAPASPPAAPRRKGLHRRRKTDGSINIDIDGNDVI